MLKISKTEPIANVGIVIGEVYLVANLFSFVINDRTESTGKKDVFDFWELQ